jgi:hypothetical protein
MEAQAQEHAMDRYKKVLPLSATDAAYVAGLVDGEGTIGLTRRHARDHRQLVISICNTEKAMLDHVATAVGAGRITSKVTYRQNHTPSYTYVIENRQAPRNGKYAEQQLEDRAKFVRAFFSITAHGRQSSRLSTRA